MYQALYRKWRPQTFSDMVGQDATVRTLRNQVKSGRVAHAYLFCGSRGTGKTSAAKIMARAINCLSPVNGDPCLACDACRMLAEDASLDVYEMDAASNSRVEEIRELLEKVNYPPQFGKHKVYIIDEVHMLSNAAFNALLKTLEEPPAYMVFILATTEPQKLPATILSRCQRFDFRRFTEEQLVSRMIGVMPELSDAEPEALALIARAAEGSMRDAWSLLDMVIGSGERVTERLVRDALGTADREFLFRFVDTLASGDCAGALSMVDELMRAGRDVQVFLRDLSAHARQAAAAKLGASAGDMTKENASRFQSQAEKIPLARFMRIVELCMRAEADTRWASSPRAVLELCALRACRESDEKEADSLKQRVDELSRDLDTLRREGIRVPAASGEQQTEKSVSPIKKEPRKADPPPAGALPADGKNLPKDIWNAALKKAAKEFPAIYAFLNQGKFAGFANGVYKLSYDAQSGFIVDYLNAPARREQLEAVLTAVGNTPARFEAVYQQAPRAESDDGVIEALAGMVGRDSLQVDD